MHGLFAWQLSIIADESVRLGKTGYSAGHFVGGATPEPPDTIERPTRAETDERKLARYCIKLSVVEPPTDWRGAIRIAHRLRAQTVALVDQHWPLISRLAAELLEHRQLDAAQIRRVLDRGSAAERAAGDAALRAQALARAKKLSTP
jgi:hypothetical protein